MGLLLGGSIITIMEILDLIVYNSLYKVSRKGIKARDNGVQNKYA